MFYFFVIFIELNLNFIVYELGDFYKIFVLILFSFWMVYCLFIEIKLLIDIFDRKMMGKINGSDLLFIYLFNFVKFD